LTAAVGTHREVRYAYRIVIEIPEWTRSLRRHWHRWEYNIKTYFKEIEMLESGLDLCGSGARASDGIF
jgi:hypothetical protein